MSHAAHLYPVPDPDDETAGERDVPAPVAVPVPPLPTEPELDDDAGDEDQDDDEKPEHRRRALSLPDLSPYYDVRPLKELGPLAVAAGRRGGPPMLRGLARVGHGAIVGVLCLLRGVRLLLVLFYAWMTGATGKGGGIPARLGITAALGYVLATAPAQHPAAPYAMATAFLLLLVAAGTGRIPEPGSKKNKKSGEKAQKRTGEKAEKEEPKDAPRSGLLARLQRLRKGREETPAVDLTKAPAGSPAEPAAALAEQSPEPVGQTPADPSPDDVIRALHQLVGEGRGVLLTTLRQHLSLPDTRAVRRVLGECSITIRAGVRTTAGNGPGVHRDDVPPLPSPHGSPQGAGVVAGQSANTNANNAANAPEEGSRADSNEWTAEEIAKGYRTVRDPERGPSAWKIEHHRG
ncbi:hypothetical protein [Streptomyces smyrnaeus]|uniref:hypothetical protein n=1 Tax=Streptomyces smyrnaeus TaxID=1387713 RepID=UPI003683A80A